ncbi:hypothetical protein [Bradyrhizobium sp. CCBAU 051011]|uniref:hypothetical protein n=1 Tax=Bradyrhizobium sp. CCBAU 051011 TaxID=858422 RepID=UPI00137AE7F9|nr:hypothetical protein [Bradyrhizobium sp. CCBAU 051011]
MTSHNEEIEILKVVFPEAYALLGEERIRHIVEKPEDNKEINIVGGQNLSLKSVYSVVKAGLGVIREVQTAYRDTFPREEKVEFTFDAKNSKVIVITTEKAIKEELTRQLPAIVQAVTRHTRSPGRTAR